MVQGRNGGGLTGGWAEVKDCVEEVEMAGLEQ